MDQLLEARKKFVLKLPNVLKDIQKLSFEEKEKTSSVADKESIQSLFPNTFGQPLLFGKISSFSSVEPLKVGVVLSGGQAAGGHNVIIGLLDGLKKIHPDSTLVGFLDGPSGIVENQFKLLDEKVVENYRNTGGFDLIGAGRTKIETSEQLEKSFQTVKKHKLNGLVVIGGDDSNTNAAVLGEYFFKSKSETKVIGVPKTIDGDLKNLWVETSFGFDTACKTYSEMIGNIQRDAISAKKYTHFIKLMGRSASHIALECALKTHPNMTFISEEVLKEKHTLQDLTQQVTDMVMKRSEMGKNYSVILIPEGLIEFIPEMKSLIDELNTLLSHSEFQSENLEESFQKVKKHLKGELQQTFEFLPESIQKQLLMDRDPHGNVQVSHIQTEKIFTETVSKELKKRAFKGKFSPVQHFFGYEGRAGFPSNFDATYCYALGMTASALIHSGKTGYMACVGNLTDSVDNWSVLGVPITSLMNIEKRKGKDKPVIQKALVELEGKPFQKFKKHRESWKLDDDYCYPGPIQYFGDEELVDVKPLTLVLERA